jgi:hypothetical protein
MSQFDTRNKPQDCSDNDEIVSTHMIDPEPEQGSTNDSDTALPAKALTGMSHPSRKREVSIEDEQEKMEARRAANRRSAFESRKRRKLLIDELQKAVIDLTTQKEELGKQNAIIKIQLESALAENRQLRFAVQQQVQQVAGAVPAAPAAPTAALSLSPHTMIANPFIANPAMALVALNPLMANQALLFQAQSAAGMNPPVQTQLQQYPFGVLTPGATADNEAAAIAHLLVQQRTAPVIVSEECNGNVAESNS